jgi:hypothetical protein
MGSSDAIPRWMDLGPVCCLSTFMFPSPFRVLVKR